jgi:hypothetical protein
MKTYEPVVSFKNIYEKKNTMYIDKIMFLYEENNANTQKCNVFHGLYKDIYVYPRCEYAFHYFINDKYDVIKGSCLLCIQRIIEPFFIKNILTLREILNNDDIITVILLYLLRIIFKDRTSITFGLRDYTMMIHPKKMERQIKDKIKEIQ